MVPGRAPATQVTLGMVHPVLILMSAQTIDIIAILMPLAQIPKGHGYVPAIQGTQVMVLTVQILTNVQIT
jgi:hypothetical protein